MQYKTFIENAYFIFKNKTTGLDAFRLMVRDDEGQNKLYLDRVMTHTAFAGTENEDWQVVDSYETPEELGGLGKFVIGGKDIEGTDYFIWAELLSELGIMGTEDTDYSIITTDN
jgi:hypothetical protein